MKIILVWSIIGLLDFTLAHDNHESNSHRLHHAGRHHKRLHYREAEESSPTPTATPASTVDESSPPSSVVTVAPNAKDPKALTNYEGLNLEFNYENKSMGFGNATSNIAIAFLFRETGSVKLVVDSKEGIVLKYQKLNQIQRIQNKDFKGGIHKILVHMANIYFYENKTLPGDRTEIEPSSEEASTLIKRALSQLGHPKDGEKNFYSFEFLNKLAEKLRRVYSGPLDCILKGRGPLPLKDNLNRFLSITMGLKKLFIRAVGGLKAILAKKVEFDLNSLFNARNGAEVFVYILRQTGAKFDLSKIWAKLLNNIEEVLKIIHLLGGGENRNGVDDTFALIGHVWSALEFRLSIPTIGNLLLESASQEKISKRDEGDFSQILKDIKNITDDQSRKYGNAKALSPFVTFFGNLTTNTLIHNGINISDIMDKYRNRDVAGGMKFAADTFFKLFSPEKITNFFFDGYLAFLDSNSNPQALGRLIPGLSLLPFNGTGGSLLDQLSHQLSNSNESGNPDKVFNSLGPFRYFSDTLRNLSGRPFSFTDALGGENILEYWRKITSDPSKWTKNVEEILIQPGTILQNIIKGPINLLNPSLGNNSNIPGIQSILPIFGQAKPDSKKDCGDDEPCKSTTVKQEGDGQHHIVTTEKECDDCETTKKPATEKSDPTEDVPRLEVSTQHKGTTEKDCDDCDTKEKPITEKECGGEDCKKTKATRPPPDLKVDVSTEAKVTTECDDCDEEAKGTKPTSDLKVEASTETEGAATIEYKHHQSLHQIRHHDHVNHLRHHGHQRVHNSKNHHNERLFTKTYHKRNHNKKINSHGENKHHFKKVIFVKTNNTKSRANMKHHDGHRHEHEKQN